MHGLRQPTEPRSAGRKEPLPSIICLIAIFILVIVFSAIFVKIPDYKSTPLFQTIFLRKKGRLIGEIRYAYAVQCEPSSTSITFHTIYDFTVSVKNWGKVAKNQALRNITVLSLVSATVQTCSHRPRLHVQGLGAGRGRSPHQWHWCSILPVIKSRVHASNFSGHFSADTRSKKICSMEAAEFFGV